MRRRPYGRRRRVHTAWARQGTRQVSTKKHITINLTLENDTDTFLQLSSTVRPLISWHSSKQSFWRTELISFSFVGRCPCRTIGLSDVHHHARCKCINLHQSNGDPASIRHLGTLAPRNMSERSNVSCQCHVTCQCHCH